MWEYQESMFVDFQSYGLENKSIWTFLRKEFDSNIFFWCSSSKVDVCVDFHWFLEFSKFFMIFSFSFFFFKSDFCFLCRRRRAENAAATTTAATAVATAAAARGPLPRRFVTLFTFPKKSPYGRQSPWHLRMHLCRKTLKCSKIARIAPILTILGPCESSWWDLSFETHFVFCDFFFVRCFSVVAGLREPVFSRFVSWFTLNRNWNENGCENESGGTCEGSAKRPRVGRSTRFVFEFVFVSISV